MESLIQGTFKLTKRPFLIRWKNHTKIYLKHFGLFQSIWLGFKLSLQYKGN